MQARILALVLLTLGVSLLVWGCASHPSRFYLLSALSNTGAAATVPSAEQGLTIGVGPVTLPRYTERPQIVTRTGPYELQLAEFDRWAEGIDANFTRVLADNLSRLMPTSRVVMSPWPRATAINYQVLIDVTHFLSQVGGESLLIANWTLLNGEGTQVLASRQARFSTSTAGQDYTAVVAAMSQTLAGLSQEIAAAIQGVGSRASVR
jgi:hypothetical protein